MSGTFVAVVGRSGAGKDSLIDYARERLSQDEATFVRRVVTREADAQSEDHDTLDRAAFAKAAEAGQFALDWEAHGLCYGLPQSLDDDLADGKVVIANLSRAVIPQLMQRYPNAVVVEVVADPDVIAQRLAGRGRETAQSIGERMSRNVSARLPTSTVQIDNSGDLGQAGERFLGLLQDLVRRPVPSARQGTG